MDLLAQLTRNKALLYFILFYSLSILLVLFISYFFFRSPTQMLVSEVKTYAEFKKQHAYLMDIADSASMELSELVAIEEVIAVKPDRSLDSICELYRDTLGKLISNLKTDSSESSLSLQRRNIANYLAAYETILYYCDNNLKLRRRLTANSNASQSELEELRKTVVHLEYDNAKLRKLNRELKQQEYQVYDPVRLWSLSAR